MIELEQAKQRLEELGLDQASVMLEAQLEKASHEQPTYLAFLNELLEVERAARQKRNLEVRTKLAHLPYRKTLEEFDFSFQPNIDERLVRELATMAFAARAENVLLLGPPGVGKSHLAVAKFSITYRMNALLRIPKLTLLTNGLRVSILRILFQIRPNCLGFVTIASGQAKWKKYYMKSLSNA